MGHSRIYNCYPKNIKNYKWFFSHLDILTLYKLNLNLIFFNTKLSEYNSIEKITEVGYKYAVEELNKYDLNQIINSWAYTESGRSELIFGSYLKYIVDKKDMMKKKIRA